MKHAHKAIIAAADQPATMQRLLNHGNPKVRSAAGLMTQITEMHRRQDYNPARERQIAEDALYYLPMVEIERLVRALALAVAA